MLYNPIMPFSETTTRFVLSLFATPLASHRDVFYTVLRGGHLIGGADHHVKRNHFPGHELILCLRGNGFVRVAGRTHRVEAGDLVWINCQQPHEHGAIAEEPWDVYWVRIEGPRLERMCQMLSVNEAPVFGAVECPGTKAVFEEIFQRMQGDALEKPAMIHAAVARLIAVAFSSRLRSGQAREQVPQALRKPLEWMRLFYFESVRVEKLAGMAGLSAPHFSRMFKATFGTSPIDWLRRERISQAKRRLVESGDSIKQIAEQVGYADRFFFSKDFKQHTGVTPGQFRVREKALEGS
jgi:AraC family transcriptional regulator, arabinose operon regulatory protein